MAINDDNPLDFSSFGTPIDDGATPFDNFATPQPVAAKPRSTYGFNPDIESAIDDAAGTHGVDPDLMRTFARIESGGDPRKRTGSYNGLFMLSADEFKRFGGDADIFDPGANARAAALKFKSEEADFEKNYGRKPSASELYFLHQQGVGGADAHWRNPEAPAWENMYRTAEGRQKGPAWAKQAIWGNLPDSEKRRFGSVENITSRDFTDFWDRRVRDLSGQNKPVQVAQAPRQTMTDALDFSQFGTPVSEKPLDFTKQSAKPESDDRWEISKGFVGGFIGGNPKNFGDALVGFGHVFERPELLSRGDDIAKWGKDKLENYKARIPSFTDIRTDGVLNFLSDLGSYAGYQTGQAVASSLPSLATGAILGGTLRNPTAARVGWWAGASVPSFIQNYGDVYGSVREDEGIQKRIKAGEITEREAATWSMMAGGAMAALDTWGLEKVLGGAFKEAKADLKRRILAGMVKGAATEGPTEAMQEVISQWAQYWLGSEKTLKQAAIEVVDNFFGGIFGGGAIGGATSAIQRPAAKAEPAPDGGRVELDAAKGKVSPSAPRTTPPPLPEEGPEMSLPDVPGKPATETPPPSPEEMSVLRRMDYTEVDIRDMEPEQRAAEMEDAQSRGIVPDAPTAEPIQDIVAQARDLADPENDRRGLYLSPDNVRQIQENPDFIEQIGAALRNQGELVQNIDGNGGILLTKDAATADAVRTAIQGGQDLQQVLGEVTGAGQGKPADATAVVQQVTPEGAVTRESAVTQDQVAPTLDAFKADGRDVRAVTPEEALARREQGRATPPPLPTEQLGDGSRQAPVRVETPEDIARAEQRVVEPTDGQKEAGNYSKGHLKFQGLDITIENPKGSIRRGTSPDGTPWDVSMPTTYGYVKRSVGRDGDQVDVYVGPNPKSDRVFIIDQVDPDTGKFDEHKAMIGYNTISAARFDYEQAFSDGRAAERMGGITEMTVAKFKDWLAKGKRTRPLSKLDEKPDAVAEQPTETAQEQADKLPDNLTDAERETLVKAWRYVNAIEQARAQGRDIQQKRLDIANELDADLASYGIEFDSFADEQSLREYLGRSRGTDQAGDAGIEAPQAAEAEAPVAEGSGRTGSPEAEVVQRKQADRGRAGDGSGQRAAEVERPKRYEGDNLTDDDIDTIVDQWKYVREVANRPKPESLAAFVIARGGIKDDAREVRQIAGAAKERPGLVNKDGWTLDDIALAAWESGFMGDMNERPTIADFLDRLQDDLHTGTVVRTADEPMLDDIRIANEIARELADYGVTTNRFRSEATLREYFGQERPATARQASRDEEAEPAAEERTGQARPDQDEVILPPDEAPEAGPSDSGITTEKSGQTSLVPEATTKEKIAAEAKKKGDRGKANADLDAGELFNPDAGKQTDLVDMAKAAPADPYLKGKDTARDHVLTNGRKTGTEYGMVVMADGSTKPVTPSERNSKSYLEVSAKTAPDLYDGPAKSADLHHNHPKSSSFSRADYTEAAVRPALRRTWVHGHDGSEYWASFKTNDSTILGKAYDIAMAVTERLTEKGYDLPRYRTHMIATMMRDGGVIEYGATLTPARADERIATLREKFGEDAIAKAVEDIRNLLGGQDVYDRRPGSARPGRDVGSTSARVDESRPEAPGSEAVGERGQAQDRGNEGGQVESQFQAEAELESLIDDVITKQFARKGKETTGPLKIGSGDILRSQSGREMSPAPNIDATTSGRATNSIKRMNAWLHSEAIKEVDARPAGRRDILGNDAEKAQLRTVLEGIDPKKATQSDQDTLNDIVFGSPEGATEANLVRRRGEKPSARKAAKAAGSAARNVIKGMDDVATGLATLFGAKANRVGSGPSFDEDTYRKAVPFFKSGISHFSKAGADIKTAVRELVSYLADTAGMSKNTILDMKPYLVRFVRDIQTGVIDPAKGDENAPDSRQGVERDREAGRSEDSLGQARVPDERVPDGSGTQPRDGKAGKDTAPARGGSVPDGDAAAVGTGRDRGVSGRPPRDERSHAGSDRSGRGGDAGVEGVPAGRVAAEAVSGTARRAPSLKEALAAQKEADATVPFELNDPDNIRAALPALKPAQQDDVVKAEARFSQPEGHGFLLTNGTGTGKTWSGLGVVKRFVKQGKSNILIVAPSQGILDGWIDTGRMLGVNITRLPDTKTAGKGIVATTYANLGDNETLADRNWDLIVADEAHKLSQNEAGSPTDALHVLRGLTNKDPYGRARMKLAPELAKLKELEAAAKANQSLRKKYEEANTAYFQKVGDLRDELAKEPRAKALFLSATPFAYRKSTDYAEGFLFDYPELTGRYNSPGGQAEFLQRNFGYAIRYNRAEEPGPEVNVGVLEREFYERLKREGVLSGRRLEVEADYDRRFVLVDDAVGAKIDQAMNWLSSEKKGRYLPLFEKIHETFNYLAQRRLLEAIKAKHVVPRIKRDLELGRKVVVFHDYNEGGGFAPFAPPSNPNERVRPAYGEKEGPTIGELYSEFIKANPYVKTLDFAQFRSPIETLTTAFPEALVYNGRIPNKQRSRARDEFNLDGSGRDIIIVQSAAGEAGISLHDTTGKHQRVLYNLGLPTRPTTAIQQEGRIYREGQVSDAILRYMSTGTGWERTAFSQTIAERASTAENLALGDEARALRDSFIDSFNDADDIPQGADEGRGGKAKDRTMAGTVSPYEKAKAFYFAEGKKRGRRDQREGTDYYATPEPIGMKMVEFADVQIGERILEPSAGHGAIARWFPEGANRVLIEPSSNLASRAGLASPGAKVITSRFEDHYIGNKYDAIVMNPPFGAGGKDALDHVQKAVGHLREGGRVVAILPRGPAADKRLEAFRDNDANKNIYAALEIDLPPVMFERAGTKVATRLVVFERHSDPSTAPQTAYRDLSDAETINDLFDRMENLSLSARRRENQSPAGQVPADVVEPPRQPVAPATAEVSFKLGETKHSRTGADLYVASIAKQVPRTTFDNLLATAKKHKGYYSSFRGSGAIPGFQFPTEENRTAFLQAINGGMREEADQEDFPRVNKEGYILALPYEKEWGNPRFIKADRERAIARLREIQSINADDAPWADLVQAKRDIDQIVTNLFYFAPDRVSTWETSDSKSSNDIWLYLQELENPEVFAADQDNQKLRRSLFSEKNIPAELADFADEGGQAIDSLLDSKRKGLSDLLKYDDEIDPVKPKKEKPVGALGDKMPSGFYFKAARKIDEARETLFQMSGQSVINWLMKEGVSRAEINHFRLWEKFGGTAKFTREQFKQAIGERMFDFRRKMSWLNPERSKRDYEMGGTRAFTGPRVPGQGIYFERPIAFPKKLAGGAQFPPGQFKSPHWYTVLQNAWASWRGSIRDVPGYGKMLVGEEGQSDYMQGASTGRRPKITEQEFLAFKEAHPKYKRVMEQAEAFLLRAIGSGSMADRGTPIWDLRIMLGNDLVPTDNGNELPRPAWDKAIELARKYVKEHRQLYLGESYAALDKLVALRTRFEEFFAPGARDKYDVDLSKRTPQSPIDENYVRVMARDLLLLAAEKNVDSISVSTSSTTARIQNNPRAAHFYDQQMKPALERELRKLTGQWGLSLQKVALPKAMGSPKSERPYTVWAAKLEPATLEKIKQEGVSVFSIADLPRPKVSRLDYVKGRLLLRQPVDLSEDARPIFDMMRSEPSILPGMIPEAVITKLTPKKGTDKYIVTARDQYGEEHTFEDDAKKITRTQGQYLVANGRPLVVLTPLDFGGDFVQTVRTVRAHEAVHALRIAGFLPGGNRDAGTTWGRLVGHADLLGVLHMSRADFYKRLGDPRAATASKDVSTFEVYTTLYGHLNTGLALELYHQEAVAHMMEVYVAGGWTNQEIAPVKAILDDILSGKTAQWTDVSTMPLSAGMLRSAADNEDGALGTDRVYSLQDTITGQSMRRDLDNLGFYSKALDAARGLKQEKGTPEQMLAQLKKAGVKDAEIQATGLDRLLKSGSTTALESDAITLSQNPQQDGFDTKTVWYRGDKREWEGVDSDDANPDFPRAMYLTTDPALASYFTHGAEGSRVGKFHLRDRNLFDFRKPEHVEPLVAHINAKGRSIYPGFLGGMSMITDGARNGDWGILELDQVQQWLKGNGFTGWYAQEGPGKKLTVAVFDEADVRPATPQQQGDRTASPPRRALLKQITKAEIVKHLEDESSKLTDKVRQSVMEDGQPMFSIGAYHGSPFDFDRFSLDHIGKGEGVQAFGPGLYFTQTRSLANFYRAKLSGGSDSIVLLDGVDINQPNAATQRKFEEIDQQIQKLKDENRKYTKYADALVNETRPDWNKIGVDSESVHAAAEGRRGKEFFPGRSINSPTSGDPAAEAGWLVSFANEMNSPTYALRASKKEVEDSKNYLESANAALGFTKKSREENAWRVEYAAQRLKFWTAVADHIERGTYNKPVDVADVAAGFDLGSDRSKRIADLEMLRETVGPFSSPALNLLTTRDLLTKDDADTLLRVARSGEFAEELTLGTDVSQADAEAAARELEDLIVSGRLEVQKSNVGFLYDVTLHVNDDELLLWDEPLSKQSERVQKALEAGGARALGARRTPLSWLKSFLFGKDSRVSRFVRSDDSVGALVSDVRNQERLRRDLLAAGIPGIKYLDGSSRKAGKGTYNYVIFDESKIEITAKNGVPLSKAEKERALASFGMTRVPSLPDTGNISRDISEAISIITRITGRDAVQVEFRDQISGTEANPAQLAAARAAGFDTRTAGGLYKKPSLDAKALIALATNDPAYDLKTAAGHEAFHHVEEVLANPAEKRLLTSDSEMTRMRALASDEFGMSPNDPRLSRLPATEIRAVAFQRYRRMREEGVADASRLHIGVRRLFDRIIQIFHGVRNVLKGYGYDSYEAIFERARTGEMADPVARRASDRPVRTLRNLIDPQMRPEGYIDREPFDLKDVRLVGRSMASVPLSDIQTIQKSVSVKAVRSKLGLPESDDGRPVSVFKYGDRYYVNDGNHRIEAMRARGAKSIRAEVIEIAPKDGDAQVLADRGPADVQAQPVGAREDNQGAQAGLSDSDVQASLIPAVAKVYTARWLRRLQPHTDRIRVYLQDKVLPIRRQEEAIEAASGIKLPEHLSVYTAEAIYHGRAGERLTDLQEQRVEPLIQHVRNSNISFDELGDYLYARHAIERNEAIRQIDPTNDAGSGMTDAEANGIVGMIEQGTRAQAFKTAAGMIDAMVKDARDTLYRAGNLTKEQYDNWTTKYKSYVPLRGFEGEVEEFGIPRVGRGMDIRGPESMQALGRRSKADNPAAYVIQQSVQAIIRSEKNRVDKTLYRLIQAHPDPDVWRVFRGEAKRRINPATGLVEMYWVPPAFAARNKDNVFGVKIAGKQHYMEILHEPLARSLRTAQPGLLGTSIGRAFYSLSRFYAQLVTSFNPEFVISNYLRDIQTALMNVGDVANAPPDVRKRIRNEALSFKSIRGVMAALQSHEGRTIFGGQRAADENMLGRKRSKEAQDYAKWFEEYRLAGGKISFIEMNDIDRIKSRVEHSIREGKTKRALRNVFDLIDNANSAVENGVRLSAYIALRKNGVSQDKAAFAARELTVNFNRKGEYGPGINAFYLFFNASVQGTTRLAQALTRSPAVRKGAASIILAGVLIDLLNYSIAGTDDDDENAYEKIDDWKKEKNMIVMLPGRKDYVQIPMPYGYNVLYLFGQKMAALSRTAVGAGKEKPEKAIAGLLGAMVESFSPMGAAPSWAQIASPTLLDPFTQIWENKNWFGGKIAPEKLPTQKHKPDSEMFFSTAPPWAIDLARALNRMGIPGLFPGGSTVKSGPIDISPESIEHMADFLLGGVGKFIGNIWNTGQRAYNDQEWIPEKTPFVRRVYGKATLESRRRDFYEKWNEVDAAHYQFETYRKVKDFEGMKRVREESPAEVAAYEAMRSAQRQISALRKQADVINLNREMGAVEKEKQLKSLTERENEIILRALKTYAKIKKEKPSAQGTRPPGMMRLGGPRPPGWGIDPADTDGMTNLQIAIERDQMPGKDAIVVEKNRGGRLGNAQRTADDWVDDLENGAPDKFINIPR